MFRRSTSTRTASAVLAAGLGLALIAAGAPASAAPARPASAESSAGASAVSMSGPYAAAADVSLLTLDVPSLSPALLPQTNVDVARSTANAESDADVDADKAGAQRTGATASTTGTTALVGVDVDLQTNEASAPVSEANEDIALDLDLSPLLDVPVIRTTALANWVSDTECVAADTPLSQSDQSLADLTLLEVAPGQSVLDLDTSPGDGAADTEAVTQLTSIPGPNDPRAVTARVTTAISSADVLNNLSPTMEHLVHADVVNSPDFTVSASGLPGGASVVGEQPTVNVTLADNTLIVLDSMNTTENAVITDLVLSQLIDINLDDLLADLNLLALKPLVDPLADGIKALLDAAQPVVRLSIPFEKTIEADGTAASVAGSLLRVEVLLPSVVTGGLAPVRDLANQILAALGADVDGPLVDLELAPYGASVVAPAGGITCGEPLNPLRELNKHASALEVAPGGTFEYNIAVPNRGPCVVNDVIVTDVITGPAGFQIIDTEPDGTIDGGKVTFDLGDLAVNQTKNITITVKVPASAKNGDTFDDVVTASGTCDGRPVTKDDRVDDTPTVRTDFSGPCDVQFSNKDASHIQVFPGETFSYYVHAFNAGGEACKNVTITDTLDSRVSFVSCNKGCVNQPADKVTWKLAEIPAGSSAILSVVVKVDDDASGVLENVAVITPENGPPATVSTRGPVIGPDSIPKDPAPASRQPLPKTGGILPTGLGALLGAGALALFALRRRATIV